jgi:putative ABC transport system substrate-binding protein
MIRRRELLTLLGGAAAAWPVVARGQQPATPVVGWLHAASPELEGDIIAAFRKGLSELGYVEGRNVTIEFRWANNQIDRLPELAADLVGRRVALIAAMGGAVSTLAAKAATATLPIVFASGEDPVATGLVASFNRPGGNVTGVSFMSGELASRRLGLLKELVPEAALYAVLVNPKAPQTESIITELRTAAAGSARQIEVFTASSNREIDAAFAGLVRRGAAALIVGSSSLFVSRRVQLVMLAAHHRLPAIYYDRRVAEAGGLMSYGASIVDAVRQAGNYTGRILKGEKPSDLPVMQPTKFELVINLHTAKTLGIEIPPMLLARADEVIE